MPAIARQHLYLRRPPLRNLVKYDLPESLAYHPTCVCGHVRSTFTKNWSLWPVCVFPTSELTLEIHANILKKLFSRFKRLNVSFP